MKKKELDEAIKTEIMRNEALLERYQEVKNLPAVMTDMIKHDIARGKAAKTIEEKKLALMYLKGAIS